ncbi:MAG: MBL fold metallo-hydrolase [Acidobacteriota bacterium]|nr:MBL fold metallo-hydrolase [Acidobacteriota bacterium]
MPFIDVGDFRITLVQAGRYLWDGGAMFGVVPKTLWSKTQPADQLNRIEAGLNCFVIDDGSQRVLVETGIGVRHDEIARQRIGMPDPPRIRETLAAHGFEPGSIDIVINTHLHWDHVGGNTVDEGGRAVPALPNARYVVQAGELEHAREQHPRDAVSYRPVNFEPILEAGRFDPMTGDGTVAPCVEVSVAKGHNRDMTIVRVRSKGETWCHLADLAMYAAQVTPTWVSAFDLFPLDGIDNKTRIMAEAARENWWCSFAHDPKAAFAKVEAKEGKWRTHQVLE